jgi:hypothetical protein
MHVQTHIMSGWVLSNYLDLTPRERGFCMLAASLADLDGLSILFGQNAYWSYHHLLCHNLAFAIFFSSLLALRSTRRVRCFFIYLSLAHLHLLLDYFGSGPGWNIYYLYPFSRRSLFNPHAWDFYSWQNITAAIVLLIWTLGIAIRYGRTPLETVMPDLDRQIVAWLRRRLPTFAPRSPSAEHRSAPRSLP